FHGWVVCTKRCPNTLSSSRCPLPGPEPPASQSACPKRPVGPARLVYLSPAAMIPRTADRRPLVATLAYTAGTARSGARRPVVQMTPMASSELRPSMPSGLSAVLKREGRCRRDQHRLGAPLGPLECSVMDDVARATVLTEQQVFTQVKHRDEHVQVAG